jgi:DNA polymerase
MRRAADAAEQSTAPVPASSSLARVRAAAEGCKACHLWRCATQTVFGEGPRKASIVMIGEQPGDQEDLEGHPFVGPAGKLLDRALSEAGIDRDEVYLTNVVKHFKFEPRGKRRIHKKPNSIEIAACLPWLEKELSLIQPDVVVCLGATASQALLGSSFKVTKERGKLLRDTPFAPIVVATVHPSSLLRAPDDATRRRETKRFIDDLKKIAALVPDAPQARASTRRRENAAERRSNRP